jgi:PAS domain S-box-containing protein
MPMDANSRMPSETSQISNSRRRLLARGESLVATLGAACASILLCALAVSGWWMMHAERVSVENACHEKLAALGRSAAPAIEALLENGDVSALRRVIAETGRANSLTECRVVLPDGRVIADQNPKGITAGALPAKWDGAAARSPEVDRGFFVEQELKIDGRGNATFRAAAQPVAPGLAWQELAGVGTVAVGGLCALLLVYHKFRTRVAPLSLVREGLLAVLSGEQAYEVLKMNERLGPEAAGWNKLLGEAEAVRTTAVAERAKDALGNRRQGRSDLDHACDTLAVGLIIVDELGKVKHCNGAAATLLRAKREEMSGSEIGLLVKNQAAREVIDASIKGGAVQRRAIEIERTNEEGGGVLRIQVRPLRKEDSPGAVITIEDVTQQRVADAARNSFVAQATHELRTPLTNMRLYLETALEDGEKDPAVRARCLNVVNLEARRLERMVGEMLSVAEIEAGSLKIRRDDVRLDKLFEEIEADFRAQAEEKKIVMEMQLPPKFPVVMGDRDKLALAVHNVVGNALKYTPQGGRVTIAAREEGKFFVVDVSDTGIGIAPSEQALVFDKFYRSKDARVSKITGTGLGLALAREVTRLHGGDVTVASEVDKGSTFTVTVPLVPTMAQAA